MCVCNMMRFRRGQYKRAAARSERQAELWADARAAGRRGPARALLAPPLHVNRAASYHGRCTSMRVMRKTILLVWLVAALCPLPATRSAPPAAPLYPVVRDDKWGFIDATGRLVIAPQFDSANGFN